MTLTICKIRWAFFQIRHHWNGNVFILMKFSSLAALKVVKMTTSSAANDENFIKMTTFSFQWYWIIVTYLPDYLLFGAKPFTLKNKVGLWLQPEQHTSVNFQENDFENIGCKTESIFRPRNVTHCRCVSENQHLQCRDSNTRAYSQLFSTVYPCAAHMNRGLYTFLRSDMFNPNPSR